MMEEWTWEDIFVFIMLAVAGLWLIWALLGLPKGRR